ncbi:hypothetical protein [Rhodococcoides corynebacterioides]|uniref:Uncharacterized protein n=1 Tax=Rhodococcoides corynebacterioides TaxID=53972 RepID=A0ABS7P3J8_9NOCA|nr:hypothetical protein [Rhodococcus corynebacterioides]MBY6366993.1 hypothetical protein [Rhodococcus corynebacterioides]MBY6407254.1 hypothetical protein [Rhodococcus corynebacterioides]
MSDVVDYATSDLEKLAEFLRQLVRLLPSDQTGADTEISGLELRRVRQVDQGSSDIGLHGDQDTPGLSGISGVGSGPQQALLSDVVARINSLFGAEFATRRSPASSLRPQAWPKRINASPTRSTTTPSTSSWHRGNYERP